jgi:penicillin-binding protein 2
MQSLNSIKVQSWLAWFLKGVLIVGFLILISRLVDLQVIKGAYFRQLSEGNRIRRVSIAAPRGRIFSRNSELLVGNIEIKKRIVFDPVEGYKKTDDITGADDSELLSEWLRDYKLGSVAAHLTGYLGEVGFDEVGKVKALCPEMGPREMGTLIGRGGLEEQYECTLRGVDGEELVEVDVQGNKVRTLGRKEPIAGKDLTISVDLDLQKKVAELMAEKKGAVIVSDSEGAILALYSSPSFDPNVFIREKRSDEAVDALNNSELPLFNRVLGGKYHPGSTYKPLVAIAALEEGIIDSGFTYRDRGQITIKTLYGDFSYANWFFTQYGGVEGDINLTRAIARSTDTFFYEVGDMLGVDKMVVWSEKFGLGGKTGIDLPGEIEGLVPSPEWKQNLRGERWFLGNTYHMAIGQGDLAVTPLGLHKMITTIANDGEFCTPGVAVGTGEDEKNRCIDLQIEKSNIDLVKEGMVAACTSGGTGFTFFDFEEKFGKSVACKTGTAEIDDTSDDTHAWFTAFAPANHAEIVVTVLVERGGEGSRVAGPIAREILNYWFGLTESENLINNPAND